MLFNPKHPAPGHKLRQPGLSGSADALYLSELVTPAAPLVVVCAAEERTRLTSRASQAPQAAERNPAPCS